MKHLVIIAGIVWPQSSPTGKSALQYANMLKNEYDITILFMQNSLDEIEGTVINGISYYSVFGRRVYIENWFRNKENYVKNKMGKQILKLLLTATKAFGRIESMLLFPNNSRWFYKKAYEKLYEINKQKKIDCIFTICSPFAAHMAGKKYKENNLDIRWITYTVDPFTSGMRANNIYLFPKLHTNRNLKEEQNVYRKADYNLVSEEIYDNNKDVFSLAAEKTNPLPYLIKKIPQTEGEHFPKDKINLLFAGRFYKEIRNPEYLLKLFIAMNDDNILLHLYSKSDCEDLVDSYISKSKGRIIKYSQVSATEIKKIMMSADIMVNVGNSISEFKPSKTFEYISTGMPIINIYENGLIDNVLEKYPLAIQVEKTNSYMENSIKIRDFCINFKNRKLSYEDIEKLYERHSFGKIKDALLTALEKINEKKNLTG